MFNVISLSRLFSVAMTIGAVSYAESSGLLPVCGWKKRFIDPPAKHGGPDTLLQPGLSTSRLLDLSRYISGAYMPAKHKNSLPPIDIFNQLIVPSIYGVPLGGIGCGTIGRGYKGEFCRSSLIPGRFNYDVGVVDQFILTVKKNGKCVYHQVLSTSTPPKHLQALRSWKWSMPRESGHFIGLYPRSWTVYDLPELNLLLICKQISPVLPGNYKDSCLPIGIFHWTALNFDPQNALEISITMTWRGPRNPRRSPPPKAGQAGIICGEVGHLCNNKNGEFTFPFEDADNQLLGCLMEVLIDDMPCCFGVSAKSSDKVHVSRCMGFNFGAKRSATGSSSGRKATAAELWRSPWGIENQSMSFAHNAISAGQLWANLSQEGRLASDNTGYYVLGKAKNRPLIGVAVCVSFELAAAVTDPTKEEVLPAQEDCDFFLTWHMPRIHFRSSLVAYRRRYVRWFSEDTIKGASELLVYASKNGHLWDKAIESWQNSILQNSGFPVWYKSALFNELYYLSDGGTVWLDPLPGEISGKSVVEDHGLAKDGGDTVDVGVEELCTPLEKVRRRNPAVQFFQPSNYLTKNLGAGGDTVVASDFSNADAVRARVTTANDMGLFAYLEAHEYRMYNTYDVHFNASWALVKLWPKLQLAVNYDFADMTTSEDRSPMKPAFKGTDDKDRILNYAFSVPHDCGDPEDEPWYHVNAYNLRATDEWKDLNPKFVLTTWRDWKVTGDDNYLLYMLPLVVVVMEKCLERWDKDEDGIIENANFPDQTYDMWKAVGLSAYVGGIWLAALFATKDMISHLHQKEENPVKKDIYASQERRFCDILIKAKKIYHETLWTDCGYRYDSHDSKVKCTVMADQLCGHWLLRTCGAPADSILPVDAVPIAINSIIKMNWRSVLGGEMGVINGTRRDSKIAASNVQANEFWVGTNYCLASLLILEGMPIDGFDLCGACYKTVYENLGLQYQTPEAYTREKTYRSPGYMRPLSIWSMQHALELRGLRYNASDAANTS